MTDVAHLTGTLKKLVDVETGHGYGEESDWGEDGEATAHVVGYDVHGVAFLDGDLMEGAATGVGDGDDALAGGFLAVFELEMILEDAESDGGLGGGAGLGDDCDGVVVNIKKLKELCTVVLAEGVAGVDDEGVLAWEKAGKLGLEGFDDGAGAEIGTAYADDYKDAGDGG